MKWSKFTKGQIPYAPLTANANIDYDFSLRVHLHGVPYRLTGETVTVLITDRLLDTLHALRRVALYGCISQRGWTISD